MEPIDIFQKFYFVTDSGLFMHHNHMSPLVFFFLLTIERLIIITITIYYIYTYIVISLFLSHPTHWKNGMKSNRNAIMLWCITDRLHGIDWLIADKIGLFANNNSLKKGGQIIAIFIYIWWANGNAIEQNKNWINQNWRRSTHSAMMIHMVRLCVIHGSQLDMTK